MDETLTELVLRTVELVPPGRLVSYRDVAALLGTGPRQVGAVMAREGHVGAHDGNEAANDKRKRAAAVEECFGGGESVGA